MTCVLNHSKFDDDLKVYHAIESLSDCSLSQSDIVYMTNVQLILQNLASEKSELFLPRGK
jgi:hypothetical protein